MAQIDEAGVSIQTERLVMFGKVDAEPKR